MTRSSYGSPTMPRYTCPAIDEVQSGIQSAQRELDDAREDSDDEVVVLACLGMAEHHLSGLSQQLEDLREANDQLRQGWEWWQARAEELEEERDELEGELSQMKEQS